MLIPHGSLTDSTLQNLIEEFVTREGTDYGVGHFSLEQKVAQVRRQLEHGIAVIHYDPDSATCHIAMKADLPGLDDDQNE
jgi:uncharacterized protein